MDKVKRRVNKTDPSAVRATFKSVAHRYDFANHFLSGGIDYLWRRRLLKLAVQQDCPKVLDVATGSGDVAFSLRIGLSPEAKIIGVDFCEPMEFIIAGDMADPQTRNLMAIINQRFIPSKVLLFKNTTKKG